MSGRVVFSITEAQVLVLELVAAGLQLKGANLGKTARAMLARKLLVAGNPGLSLSPTGTLALALARRLAIESADRGRA